MITEHIRVGYLSAIHWSDGTADIVYKSLDNSVTKDVSFPLLFCSKAKVDDPVWVLHRQGGRTSALCLGRYWFDDFRPIEGFRGLFRLAFSRKQDRAYIKYTDPDENDGDNDGKLLLHNDDDFRVEVKNFELAAEENISLEAKQNLTVKGQKVRLEGGVLELMPGQTLNIEAHGGNINISGAVGDIVLNGKSHTGHRHAWAGANTGGPVAGMTEPPQ